MKLAYSPYGGGDSIEPFDQVFSEKQDAKEEGFKGADAFLLWGGTDIHPSFYKETRQRFSGAPAMPSDRDKWEWKAMQYCKAMAIPIIGVCRGAQFVCAFAGGKLIQHVSGHANGNHNVVDQQGNIYNVTSSHHQMMDVHGTQHSMLAWSQRPLSNIYYDKDSKTPKYIADNLAAFREPEIVFFPKIKGLAIQGHPEWSDKDSLFVIQVNKYIKTFLLEKENETTAQC